VDGERLWSISVQISGSDTKYVVAHSWLQNTVFQDWTTVDGSETTESFYVQGGPSSVLEFCQLLVQVDKLQVDVVPRGEQEPLRLIVELPSSGLQNTPQRTTDGLTYRVWNNWPCTLQFGQSHKGSAHIWRSHVSAPSSAFGNQWLHLFTRDLTPAPKIVLAMPTFANMPASINLTVYADSLNTIQVQGTSQKHLQLTVNASSTNEWARDSFIEPPSLLIQQPIRQNIMVGVTLWLFIVLVVLVVLLIPLWIKTRRG
jgi:hypothetical protein